MCVCGGEGGGRGEAGGGAAWPVLYISFLVKNRVNLTESAIFTSLVNSLLSKALNKQHNGKAASSQCLRNVFESTCTVMTMSVIPASKMYVLKCQQMKEK